MYVLRKHGKTIKVYRNASTDSPLNEISRDEIAKTLVLYHEALLTQRERARRLESDRERLLDEMAQLKQRLDAAEAAARQGAAAAMVAQPMPKVAQTRKMPSFRPTAPADGARLGLLQALVDANKQLRKELANG